jgi:hypothetical protein
VSSTAAFDSSAIGRWRAEPAAFIEQVLINPETSEPFVLLPAEREFLKHALTTGSDDRLLHPELIYSAPKKSGKTVFAALMLCCAGADEANLLSVGDNVCGLQRGISVVGAALQQGHGAAVDRR